MPTVEVFGSAKMKIMTGDHDPPHVHVVAPDFNLNIEISQEAKTLKNFANKKPDAKQVKEMKEFIRDNEATLLEQWRACNDTE